MKVLVCGSRTWTDEAAIRTRLAQLPAGTVVMHGGARGADTLASNVAHALGLVVAVFPAEWKRHGRQAGFIRNQEMMNQQPDLVIAFWDGQSRGTAHTLELARASHIPVEIL